MMTLPDPAELPPIPAPDPNELSYAEREIVDRLFNVVVHPVQTWQKHRERRIGGFFAGVGLETFTPPQKEPSVPKSRPEPGAIEEEWEAEVLAFRATESGLDVAYQNRNNAHGRISRFVTSAVVWWKSGQLRDHEKNLEHLDYLRGPQPTVDEPELER